MLSKAYIAGLLTCLLASSASAGQLDATWSAVTTNTDGTPVAGPVTYRIYYFLFPNTPCPGTQFLVTNPGATTQNIPGLTQGMTYNVQATAVDAFGTESACSLMASGVARADTAGNPPLAASNVQITFAQPPPQTSVNFGDTTIEATSASNIGGALIATLATLPRSGTLKSLSIYSNAASAGNWKIAIYDTSGPNGDPGTLLLSTLAFHPVAGWNTILLPSPFIQLTNGNYWLAFTIDNNADIAKTQSGRGSSVMGFSFTTPSAFPTIQSRTQASWSVYGTVSIP